MSRPLPDDFQFSQASLQALVDCPRLFQLQYQRRQAWPAIVTEPLRQYEDRMEQGVRFHQMVHQHLLGMQVPSPDAAADPDLARWWDNFVAEETTLPFHDGECYPELSLAAEAGDHGLLAQYDAVVAHRDGSFTILDWKTDTRAPDRQAVAARLQTRVYLYVLSQAGAALQEGRAIDPSKIRMMYWYADFPDAPLVFDYSQAQLREDRRYIMDLLDRAGTLDEELAPVLEDDRRCRRCLYRSFCGKSGVPALPDLAEAVEAAGDTLHNFSLDDVEEIRF